MITIIYHGPANDIILIHVNEKQIIEENGICRVLSHRVAQHVAEIEYSNRQVIPFGVSWSKNREIDRIKPAIRKRCRS